MGSVFLILVSHESHAHEYRAVEVVEGRESEDDVKNGMRQMIGWLVVMGAAGCDASTSATALEPENRGRRDHEALVEQAHTITEQQRSLERLEREVGELHRASDLYLQQLNRLTEVAHTLRTARTDAEQRLRALHRYVIRTQCDGFVAAQTACRHGQWVNETCSRQYTVPRACLRIGANYPRFPAWAYTDWEPVRGYDLPIR